MTDLELFKQFYFQIGINLKQYQDSPDNTIIYRIGADDYDDNGVNHSSKFVGYFNFYSSIEFTPDGKFVKQGFWE
ncbi:MAG: hypothetical protein WC055_00925 [Melioribacteraceae bacterium]